LARLRRRPLHPRLPGELPARNRRRTGRDGGIRLARSPRRRYGMRLGRSTFVSALARPRRYVWCDGREARHRRRRRSGEPETPSRRPLFLVKLLPREDWPAIPRGRSSSRCLERKASFPATDNAGGRRNHRRPRAGLRKKPRPRRLQCVVRPRPIATRCPRPWIRPKQIDVVGARSLPARRRWSAYRCVRAIRKWPWRRRSFRERGRPSSPL